MNKVTLAFYPVYNSQDYDRHSLDGLEAYQQVAQLAALEDGEVHLFEYTEGYEHEGRHEAEEFNDYDESVHHEYQQDYLKGDSDMTADEQLMALVTEVNPDIHTVADAWDFCLDHWCACIEMPIEEVRTHLVVARKEQTFEQNGESFKDWADSDLFQYAMEESTIGNVLDVVQKYVDENTFHQILSDVCMLGDSEVRY